MMMTMKTAIVAILLAMGPKSSYQELLRVEPKTTHVTLAFHIAPSEDQRSIAVGGCGSAANTHSPSVMEQEAGH